MNERQPWLDIAKGIGIILVVIGHSGHLVSRFIYWFHMPMFFLISGLLFKPVKSTNELGVYIYQKTTRSLVPYFIFGLLIALTIFSITGEPSSLIKNLARLVYGGQSLVGYFGIFWFVTVLLLTQITFAIINLKLKPSFQVALILIFYMIAHSISKTYLAKIKFPWNLDVVLIAIFYFSIGYYFKEYIEKLIQSKLFLYCMLITSFLFLYLEINHFVSYRLDFKNNIYNSVLLDILIPLTFSFLIFSISHVIDTVKPSQLLSKLGRSSLIIMYLHIPINQLLLLVFEDINVFVYTLAGVLIPIVVQKPISLILNRTIRLMDSYVKKIAYN